MPSLSFTPDQLRAEAVRLGLIAEGEELPARLRSRVVAALAAAQTAARPRSETPPIAEQITVQPGGDITVDGRPFPWLVQADQMSLTLAADGSGMVRLTIPAKNIQILKPADESENRA